MERERMELLEAIETIQDQCRALGLDPYPMHFELCPADVMHIFGSYGMPTRFNHWSFGKCFYKMKLHYEMNLGRIYEMVIHSNPCYAFLLESNKPVENKMVIAHAFAHSDFFKNNLYFRNDPSRVMEKMASHAAKIRKYEFEYGRRQVEIFLDAALALQQHVEPGISDDGGLSGPGKMDLNRDNKDMVAFIAENSRNLEDWQRDILWMLREEMLYFWPQKATRVINEGWATYWHTRIMRRLDLAEAEAVDFARLHAEVLRPNGMQFNPYHVGSMIFENIEKRWDNPTTEEVERYGRQRGTGRWKIFEVRTCENDVSLLRNYLTKALVEQLDLYIYRKVESEWVVVEKDWEKVRDGLVRHLVNCGVPYIVVEEKDFGGKGDLYLRHRFEGLELDIPYLEKTLHHLYLLWGRPVYLETVIDGRNVVYSYDGKKNSRRCK